MAEHRDFTQGSVLGHIWALSMPTMIAFALQTSFNIVDTIFVGRLGAEAIAAVSIVFPVMVFIIALGAGTGIGASSLVARFMGGKKFDEAGRVAEHAVLVALFFSVILALLGSFFARPLFVLMGATPSVLSLSMSYNRWIVGFCGFVLVFITLSNILRGEGDAKTPMKYMIVSVLTNVVLDPLLIFGPWFFPRLGVEGAAIATVISQGVGCALLIAHVLSGRSLVKFAFRKFKYSFDIVKGIFSVGIPASLSHVVMSVGMVFITKIVAYFGPAAIAAYGIGYKLESISFHFAIGIALAVVTLVGHNFGAGNLRRAKGVAWVASGLSMVVTFFIGLAFFLTPNFWIRIFTSDASVIGYGVSLVRVLALFFAFTSLGITIESAFQGFGRGMPKFLLTLLRLGVLAVPLAYMFSKSFGLVGVWYGLAISYCVSGLVAVLWFRLSSFEKSKVL